MFQMHFASSRRGQSQPVRRPIGSTLVLVVLAIGVSLVVSACAPATQAPAVTQAPVAAQPTQAPAQAPTQVPAATKPAEIAPTAAATQAPAPTAAPVAAAPAAVSFAKDVKPILDQRCSKCHGGSDGTKGGLSVQTYDDLMAGGQDGQVINPGDAANSMMVQAIVSGKMPKRAAKLPQTEIDVISAWVAAGAKNN